MLEFAIKYQQALDAVTDTQKLGLGTYELDDVLKILKHTTLFFSCGTPNLAMVIPAMDHINTVFTNGIIKTQTLHPAIRAALHVAKITLNRYYSLTDESETYWIVMILHPCYKLDYFTSARWQDDWISTARNIVQQVYECSYKSCLPTPVAEEGRAGTAGVTNKVHLLIFSFSLSIHVHLTG
ncbi:uncharacterized protein EDB91DRAFT_1054358 [Suillus paluster]|uniref:uncharacterized protein n=1 Tax=Suillus paluster TaxID=48578 RepID=UPI001B86CAAF|nr:uncharacterized protein EDB91DRAFT_1054358 [Suillus paluster]KAG1738826.1 hypothetical protein EDB91DRAFT_1054358 [Suillus paluster]